MKKKLLTLVLSVFFLLSLSNNLYAGSISTKNNLSSQFNIKLGSPPKTKQSPLSKAQKSSFVDKGDYYFLNTGKKKSFLRKEDTFLIIYSKKKKAVTQFQSILKSQFGDKLDIINKHPQGKNMMFRIKEGKNSKDIVSELLQTDTSIDFISPVLTNKSKSTEVAITPNIVVSINKDENTDSVVATLQSKYNLSLVSKLSFTDTEFEFKIEEPISDVGRIFEITREIAQLPSINWVEPNFLISPQKLFTPNDTLFNDQWHLHNTGQNGAAVDVDTDAPEG